PTLVRFLPRYPEIKIEIMIDYGLTDIVAQRFDAGVRPGETVASGMISIRIAPDMRMAVVGAPAYFAERKPPKVPQDLTDHNCINLRLPTHGGLYAWEFEKHGREMNVRVDGQLILGTATFILMACISSKVIKNGALRRRSTMKKVRLADIAREAQVGTATVE